jgi:hypothetical protein
MDAVSLLCHSIASCCGIIVFALMSRCVRQLADPVLSVLEGHDVDRSISILQRLAIDVNADAMYDV